MTIFELLFILVLLGSVVTLAIAGFSAIRGHRAKAFKMLRIYGTCAAAYLITGIAVSFFKPQRVIRVGDPWCFDDWCLTIEKVSRMPSDTTVSYEIGLRIFSQAGRVSQRAKGAWIYLIDNGGHRYSPDPDPLAIPIDVLLQPQESVATSRLFRVPANVNELGLITGHGGPYCGPMDFLIIGGGGCLFGKPTMIKIQ